MSKEKVLCSHQLVIRLDYLEGDQINWYLLPDEEVTKTREMSLVDLAESGAPLSLMGIRAIWKTCADGAVFNALEVASMIRNEVARRQLPESQPAALEAPPEGATIN